MKHRQFTLAANLRIATAALALAAGPIPTGILHAQSPPDTPVFEVVSVKPADPAARGVRIQFTPGGGLDAQNVRVRQLITLAYEIQSFQLSGGPSWLETEGFNILAKAPPAPGTHSETGPPGDEQRKQIRQRVKAMLADRFHLVIHRDSKEAPVYALVVAKNGHRMRDSVLQNGLTADHGAIAGEGVSMSLLAGFLGGRLGRPVLDRTGLNGTYDFKLQYVAEPGELSGKGGPEVPIEKIAGAAASDPSGPSLFAALQDQLGLKLESQKAPVETIVIDRVEKPAAN